MFNSYKFFCLLILFSWPFDLALSEETRFAPIYSQPLNWVDDQGKPVKLSFWQGKTVIISMAYSTCRKFCPLTIARMNELQRLFDQHGKQAEFVIVSYDPAGDTWQSWAAYRKTRNLTRENWHFLVGNSDDTIKLSQLLGMNYWLYDEHVMHNFKLVRLGSNGEIQKTLDWESQEKLDSMIPE
jgi:cytochrome oxidase Cu insertion factor (SCO1/SenC/PrrC family)